MDITWIVVLLAVLAFERGYGFFVHLLVLIIVIGWCTPVRAPLPPTRPTEAEQEAQRARAYQEKYRKATKYMPALMDAEAKKAHEEHPAPH